MVTVKSYKGLNNVSDPLRLGLSWLTTADNVNITDTGAIEKRDGYALVQAGTYRSAYNTLDYSRSYYVKGSQLVDFPGTVLATLTSTAPMHWAEINDQVYYNNGTDSGVIQPDNSVLQWSWSIPTAPTVSLATGTLASGIYSVCCTYVLADGRETGPSDPVEITLGDGQAISISSIPHTAGAFTRVYITPANSTVYQLAATTTGSALVWNFSNDALGQELRTQFMDPLPAGDVIQFWNGRAFVAQHDASNNQSAVWVSEPLGFHLFNQGTGFFMVPNKVLMLAPIKAALIVGTDTAIYAYSGDKLDRIADYGVVPGQHWAAEGDAVIFWTTRGVCSALPFSNLTEAQVSVAPGVQAGGAIVRQGGQVRYVVSLQQGGAAFNSH